MNKIFLASLIILIAQPVRAMDDDPDRQANPDDIELANLANAESARSEHVANESHAQNDSAESDRRIHINVLPAAVNIPRQDDRALRSIADKIGGFGWQQSAKAFSSSLNTIGIICMLCSVGDKISNAIRGQKLECTCTCPKCPNINFPMAPTPLMMMRNDTTNSTSDGNSTLVNGTTSYSSSTYSSNTATFMAMIGNMTKQKMD